MRLRVGRIFLDVTKAFGESRFMQGLIIATNIIGVLAISLAAYTAVIYHQVSKLDKERQSEFCNQHYKKILTLLIVNVIICAGSLGGYIALTIFSAESSVIVFPLISWFASDFSVIALSAFIISAKKKRKHKNKVEIHDTQDNSAINIENEENLRGRDDANTISPFSTVESVKHDLVDGNATGRAAMDDANGTKNQNTSQDILLPTSIYLDGDDEENKIDEESSINDHINEEIARFLYENEQEQQALINAREEAERKRKEEEERIENERKLLFKEISFSLTKKYANSVKNFIRKLTEQNAYPFIYMFKNSAIPMSSTLLFPYRDSVPQSFINAVEYDGLEFTESTDVDWNNKIQELTIFYIDGLKKRIKENDEWQDKDYLPALLYAIVRNNVIKYYHDEYRSKYGYQDLKDFCQQISLASEAKTLVNAVTGVEGFTESTLKLATIYYTYYYIYENDINLSFMKTYLEITEEVKKSMLAHGAKKLEDDLFGTPKARPVTNTNCEAKMQPIDYIDNMTGEEFELFMTQYFAEHGFKVTHTPLSGDYGIDLILENDFVKIGVQAKCYSNKVTLSAIQEVVAGLRHYGLSSGMVVTNNYFQPSAIQLAKENNITLWDRNKLIEKLGQ